MKEEAAPAPNTGRCIYGYALVLICSTGILLYLVWALTPSNWLCALGLTYFSSKYYPLAIPTFCCSALFMFAAIIYPSINLLLTKPIDSPHTISDSNSRFAKHGDHVDSKRKGIPPISDLRIEDVNQILYLSDD